MSFFVSDNKLKNLTSNYIAILPTTTDETLASMNVPLKSLHNKKKENLLLYAAQCNCLPSIQFLLEQKFDINYSVKEKIAIDYVSNESNYSEILLVLLLENSRFPKEIKNVELSRDLKRFIKDMKNIHNAMIRHDLSEVYSLRLTYPKLQYFFVPLKYGVDNNVSLYYAALMLSRLYIKSKLIEMKVIPTGRELEQNCVQLFISHIFYRFKFFNK